MPFLDYSPIAHVKILEDPSQVRLKSRIIYRRLRVDHGQTGSYSGPEVGFYNRKFRQLGNDKRARDLQSERTLRGRKDDAIATLRLSEIAIWRQLISRRETFSFSGPLT
jgi:hypothetical protein